ncbi:MAG: response regulator [Candidatus Omnitrophota bacterium]
MSAKILVVDDESAIITAVETVLKQKGYIVESANDASEAMEKMHLHNPDLIILDLMLPEMDGHTIHHMIKEDSKYKDIPVIMLTACAEFESMKKGMDTGAAAYLTKPFDAVVLLGIVKGLLGEVSPK